MGRGSILGGMLFFSRKWSWASYNRANPIAADKVAGWPTRTSALICSFKPLTKKLTCWCGGRYPTLVNNLSNCDWYSRTNLCCCILANSPKKSRKKNGLKRMCNPSQKMCHVTSLCLKTWYHNWTSLSKWKDAKSTFSCSGVWQNSKICVARHIQLIVSSSPLQRRKSNFTTLGVKLCWEVTIREVGLWTTGCSSWNKLSSSHPPHIEKEADERYSISQRAYQSGRESIIVLRWGYLLHLLVSSPIHPFAGFDINLVGTLVEYAYPFWWWER